MVPFVHGQCLTYKDANSASIITIKLHVAHQISRWAKKSDPYHCAEVAAKTEIKKGNSADSDYSPNERAFVATNNHPCVNYNHGRGLDDHVIKGKIVLPPFLWAYVS
jgi:hypothetical protein